MEVTTTWMHRRFSWNFGNMDNPGGAARGAEELHVRPARARQTFCASSCGCVQKVCVLHFEVSNDGVTREGMSKWRQVPGTDFLGHTHVIISLLKACVTMCDDDKAKILCIVMSCHDRVTM